MTLREHVERLGYLLGVDQRRLARHEHRLEVNHEKAVREHHRQREAEELSRKASRDRDPRRAATEAKKARRCRHRAIVAKRRVDHFHAEVLIDEGKIAHLKARISEWEGRHDRTRVMFDDTDVSLIPSDAEAVGAYVNGNYRTIDEVLQRFPHAKVVRIDVSGEGKGDCLDIETGDATNGTGPVWTKGRQEHGVHTPKLYTSVSNVDALVAVMTAAGFKLGIDYLIWAAHYGYGKHICGPHSCGLTQHACHGAQWTDLSHGVSLDESFLAPGFLD